MFSILLAILFAIVLGHSVATKDKKAIWFNGALMLINLVIGFIAIYGQL